MTNAAPQQSRKVQNWLLAVLRFAVTLEEVDFSVLLALAKELDRLGLNTQSRLSFFVRTTTDLCDCIVTKDSPEKIARLRTHLSRIDNDRLRAALAAALEIERSAKRRYRSRSQGCADLQEVTEEIGPIAWRTPKFSERPMRHTVPNCAQCAARSALRRIRMLSQ